MVDNRSSVNGDVGDGGREGAIVGGMIAILAALLGAITGALASIWEIRRLRREIREETKTRIAAFSAEDRPDQSAHSPD